MNDMEPTKSVIDLYVAVRLKDEAWVRLTAALDAYQVRQSLGTKREVTRARRELERRKEQWGTAWRLDQLGGDSQ